MSNGIEEIQQVQQETEPVLEETSAESEGLDAEPEIPEGESARDTVARILEEAKEGDGYADEPTKEESSLYKPKDEDVVAEQPEQELKESKKDEKEPGTAPVDEMKPPQRLSAEEKQIFNKAPKELKSAIHKLVSEHEAKFTQTQAEAKSAQKEASHIVEAVRPYLLANPHLAERGYTESRIVAELIGTHQALVNPKTNKGKWLEIGAQIGLEKELLTDIQEVLESEGSTVQANIGSDPTIQALQTQVAQLTSKLEAKDNAEKQSGLASVVREMQSVRDEVDSAGNYKYPKLHDENFVQTQVKPLVSALVRTIPGVTYAEALRKAYNTLEGNSEPAPVQNKFHEPQNTQPKVVRNASASVRGKTAVPNVNAVGGELPVEAMGNARDTVKEILKQMRGA